MGKLFEYTILSEKYEELSQLIGCKIVGMIKISYETYQDHLNYLDEVHKVGYRDCLSFFQFSFGGLLIVFDNGTEYHFGSAEDLNSIIMACEKSNDGRYCENYYLNDPHVLDKTSISDIETNNDFMNLLNVPINMINIFKQVDMNVKQQCLPSEVGIEFILNNKRKLILSHNLTQDNFVFGILTDKDNIFIEYETIPILKK